MHVALSMQKRRNPLFLEVILRIISLKLDRLHIIIHCTSVVRISIVRVKSTIFSVDIHSKTKSYLRLRKE